MSYEIINLTPHEVRVENQWGTNIYPPSGEMLRIEENVKTEVIYTVVEPGEHPVHIADVHYGGTHKLPFQPYGGRFFLVSLVTALAAQRPDFLVPYDEIRDDSGRIIGCRRLARVV